MRKPPPVVDRIRCSACGMWNDPKTTPSGGEYNAITITNSGGDLEVSEGHKQGCAFCDCPIWNAGGKLGDMRRGRI